MLMIYGKIDGQLGSHNPTSILVEQDIKPTASMAEQTDEILEHSQVWLTDQDDSYD